MPRRPPLYTGPSTGWVVETDKPLTSAMWQALAATGKILHADVVHTRHGDRLRIRLLPRAIAPG